MSVSRFSVKKDDTKPYLAIQIVNESDDSAYDLSSCTVKFYMENMKTGENKINGVSATVTSATDGEVEYRWADGDTDTPGEYLGEFKVTDANEKVFSVPANDDLIIDINDDYSSDS